MQAAGQLKLHLPVLISTMLPPGTRELDTPEPHTWRWCELESKFLVFLSFFSNCSLSRPAVLNVWSLGLQHQHYLGACCKCTFSGLIPGLGNERAWVWDPAICVLANLPGDSDASSSSRTVALKYCFQEASCVFERKRGDKREIYKLF